MSGSHQDFKADIEAINKIAIIPSILNVVCRTTGMGFAAIARVTENRWITCSAKDDISLGLKPGDELKVETTLCHEVHESRKAILIDNVDKDIVYLQHPTPQMYGFKSYISVPIYRKDGSFFGTLCSLDPKPANLSSPEILEMFNLFADLISFHLDTVENLEKTTRKLEEERKTGELREQFIAILGHDLRNPVGTTRMGADVILKKSDDEHIRKLAQLIKTTSYRMENLIGNVLDFARGRLGDGIYLNLKQDKDELKRIVLQVIKETEATKPGITIESNIHLENPVTCDTNRVGQLFSNLLSNAVHHGDATAPIKVAVESGNGEFELTVTNKGEKIPDAAMERLFKPFSRQELKPEKEGLGLGLYISSEIANAHGGKLTAKSSDEETSFSFKMPLNTPPKNENKI